MQVSITVLVIIAEIYIALLIAAIIFFAHARKLKLLVRRQQEKLLELLNQQKNPVSTTNEPGKSYKSHLNQELDATAAKFSVIAPTADIAAEQSSDSPTFQRILALRYGFLRAEELGTTETIGTDDYWSIFQQALTPFLQPDLTHIEALQAELETCKKRIENLEKFKRLFFDMEKQWANAKSNANDYYTQLMAMSEGVTNQEGFNDILQRYHNVYDDIHHTVIHTIQNPESTIPIQSKTINITRQDPRAADEIIKLRNVAADQHRIINQLQRQLTEAQSPEEKEIVIQELQQQLQRQIRFVQESETCVQLLEDELQKVHDSLALAEKALSEATGLGEENQLMKSTLHNFTMESKDMVTSINDLENENQSLKQSIRDIEQNVSTPQTSVNTDEMNQLQNEFTDLKKQYAELEERYLDLKLSSL